MASSKTLTPTNVTISIPAMTDVPDASVFSNCVDKEADAINTLNSNFAKYPMNGDTAKVTYDMDFSNGRMTFYFDTSNGDSMRLWLVSTGFILQKKAANETSWTTLKTV